MKTAPNKIRSLKEAILAPVLDKPYIYSSGGIWCVFPSASRYKNQKAFNFCDALNKPLIKKNQEASGEREPSQAQLL